MSNPETAFPESNKCKLKWLRAVFAIELSLNLCDRLAEDLREDGVRELCLDGGLVHLVVGPGLLLLLRLAHQQLVDVVAPLATPADDEFLFAAALREAEQAADLRLHLALQLLEALGPQQLFAPLHRRRLQPRGHRLLARAAAVRLLH